MSIFLLVLGLVLFVLLVVVHELGHFIAARRNGVDVEEFGIGFPPRAASKVLKSGLLLSLNWLPLGGFVRLKGEHDSDSAKGSYGRATLKTKTKIMLAGVSMNLVAAFVLLTILAWVGMPKLVDKQFNVKSDTKTLQNQVLVGFVESNSPAAKAKRLITTDFTSPKNPADALQPRDQIISFQDVAGVENPTTGRYRVYEIKSAQELVDFTKSHPSAPVEIRIIRDKTPLVLYTQLRSKQEVEASKKTSNPKGYLGVSPSEYTLERATWSAPIVAGGLIVQFTALTLQGLWHALSALFSGHTGQASAQVTGPVGIYAVLKSGSLLGYQFILMIVAIISLTLAIMNVLPIPALDGGRLFVTYLYRLIRRPLTQRAEDTIHGTGFALLMILFVLITIVDIKRFF